MEASASNTPRILDREPLVLNNRSYSWITNRICGIVENKQPEAAGRLGLGHYELRVLDRYRSRRNADFGHFVPDPSEVAHVRKSRR
jgi:hypothetical protein